VQKGFCATGRKDHDWERKGRVEMWTGIRENYEHWHGHEYSIIQTTTILWEMPRWSSCKMSE
jgi:hypothetical protein